MVLTRGVVYRGVYRLDELGVLGVVTVVVRELAVLFTLSVGEAIRVVLIF